VLGDRSPGALLNGKPVHQRSSSRAPARGYSLCTLSISIPIQALLLSPPLLPVASSPVLVAPTPCSSLSLAPLDPDALALVPLASFADEFPVAPVWTGRAEALVLSLLEGVAEERVLDLGEAVCRRNISRAQRKVEKGSPFALLALMEGVEEEGCPRFWYKRAPPMASAPRPPMRRPWDMKRVDMELVEGLERYSEGEENKRRELGDARRERMQRQRIVIEQRGGDRGRKEGLHLKAGW